MARRSSTREWKPRDQYLRDKIAYHEQKLAYEYDQLARLDPDWRPNLVPNPDLSPRRVRATVERGERIPQAAPAELPGEWD